MTIGSDYPTPVIVNGFSCKNCTDVDYAKRHIDPEHPKSGPYGINAKDDPTVKNTLTVVFGGNLASLNDKQAAAPGDPELPGNASGVETAPEVVVGAQLNLTV
jgi:hypothetical protein